VLLRHVRDAIAAGVANDTKDRASAISQIEDVLSEVFAKHVVPFSGAQSDRQLRLLVAVRDKQGCSLCENSMPTLGPVDWHVSVGYGSDIGSYLLESVIGHRQIISAFAVPLLVYVIQQAKKYSLYCGGETHIICLGSDGMIDRVHHEDIAKIEQAFEKADPTNGIWKTAAKCEYKTQDQKRTAEFERRMAKRKPHRAR
jgi:hypothetical protein